MSGQLNNLRAAFKGHPRSPFYGRALAYMPGATPGFRVPPGTVLGVVDGEGPKDSVFKVLDPNGHIPDQLERAAALGYRYVELGVPDEYRLGAFMELLTHIHALNIGVIARNAVRSIGPYQYLSHPNVFGCVVERGAGTPVEYNKLRLDVHKDGLLPLWFVFDGASGADGCAEEIRLRDLKGMGVSFSAGMTRSKYDDSHLVLTPNV